MTTRPPLAAVLAAGLLVLPLQQSVAQTKNPPVATAAAGDMRMTRRHDIVGMWVTKDGHIRHELLPNGRYDEARGNHKSAYKGRYAVKGLRIDYLDDTGFAADGEFVDGVLHHAGMVLWREQAGVAPDKQTEK